MGNFDIFFFVLVLLHPLISFDFTVTQFCFSCPMCREHAKQQDVCCSSSYVNEGISAMLHRLIHLCLQKSAWGKFEIQILKSTHSARGSAVADALLSAFLLKPIARWSNCTSSSALTAFCASSAEHGGFATTHCSTFHFPHPSTACQSAQSSSPDIPTSATRRSSLEPELSASFLNSSCFSP